MSVLLRTKWLWVWVQLQSLIQSLHKETLRQKKSCLEFIKVSLNDLILAVSFSKHVRPLIAKELVGGGIYNFVRTEHYIQDPKQFVQVMTCYERTANVMKYRTSRPDVFCKKGVLRNFTKFTGKHLCHESLFQ